MADKLTRLDVMIAVRDGDFDTLATDAAKDVATRYIASVEKQKSKPKEKTLARKQNERIMNDLLPLIEAHGKPVTATWACEQMSGIRDGIISSQKMTRILQIGIEWGKIKRVKDNNEILFLLEHWTID